MGGYFNDHGINMMHDNFFLPMAEETKCLLSLADQEAPDFTALLHGGANTVNHVFPTYYLPKYINEKVREFEERLDNRMKEKNLRYNFADKSSADGASYPPPSFNLSSALHHVCGGISIVYKSNQGLDHGDVIYSYDEILDSHMVLFEEVIRFCLADDFRSVT